MRAKTCRYCGNQFDYDKFPAQFRRMVTCGSTKCMGMRRLERVRVRSRIR